MTLNKYIFKHNRKIKNVHIRYLLSNIYYFYLDLSKLINYRKLDIFDEVIIETTSLCNRKCSYCPISTHVRQRKLMDSNLYKKIIDELGEIDFRGKIGYHLFSEPLLDSRLDEFVLYTRNKLKKSEIMIYTNGDCLDKNRYNSLLKSGVSMFYVTIHENNIGHKFKKDLIHFEKKYLAIRYMNKNSLLLSRGGLIKPRFKEVMLKCRYPSNCLYIDVEGNVILCSEDFFSKYNFGNIKEESLMNIRNKKEFKKIRDETRKGTFKLDICKKCTGS